MTKKNHWLVYLGADQPPLRLEKASVVWGLTVASDYLSDTTRQPYNEVHYLSDGYFFLSLITCHWTPSVVEKSPHFWGSKGRVWAEAAARSRGPSDPHVPGRSHYDRLEGSPNPKRVCV